MKDKIISKKEIIILIISALLITIVHNLKLDSYFQNILFPFLITLISYSYILIKKYPVDKKAFYLLLPIILIIISNLVVNIDFSNKALNVIVLPIILAFYFLRLINKNFKLENNSLKWLSKLFPTGLFENLKFLVPTRDNQDNKKIQNIILGVFLGGILGLIILFLLASADAYFNAFLKSITPRFDFKNIIFFTISFILLFSIMINILLNKDFCLEKTKTYKIDNIIILIALSIINTIFILFLISEISKITTNFLHLPIKYTYASYAREGFFQLLFVTIINFTIIMFLQYKTKIKIGNNNIKKLILLLITFSIILIFNSYYRMFLYIGNYGFTVLRLQVILFLAMEIILFILSFRKVLKDLKTDDTFTYFIIIVITYIINLYLCNQEFVNFIMKYFK